ncbi:MAG: hypothetical protein PHX83_16890 [Acidobacteriia bacterium]|nr:hypothetical protein [Terriglobia bacterium]
MKKTVLCFLLMCVAVLALPILSAAQGLLHLPSSPVGIHTGAWLGGTMGSTMDITLNSVPAGFSVTNATYVGWCAEDNFQNDEGDYSSTLYDSTGPVTNMPVSYRTVHWGSVNYLLNHKAGDAFEVQAALWLVMGTNNPTNPFFGPPDANTTAMVNAANANPSFVPSAAQVAAVPILADGYGAYGASPDNFQDTVIEVKVPGQSQPVVSACTLGYPDNSNPPRSSVVFNENTVLAAFAANNGTIMAWANDEHALLLGVRTTGFPVSALPSDPGHVSNPSVGNPSISDGYARPFFPALFLTDVTTSPSSRSGDWQQGGTGIPPNDIFGTWKGATLGSGTNGIITDKDPAKNNWKLGAGSDTPPGGFSLLTNQGYGTEVRWTISSLPVLSGHTYRAQFMVHDGDQNKTGGDVGEACVTIMIP